MAHKLESMPTAEVLVMVVVVEIHLKSGWTVRGAAPGMATAPDGDNRPKDSVAQFASAEQAAS